MTSPLLSTLFPRLTPQLAASEEHEETCSRNAREESRKRRGCGGGGGREKKEDNFNNTRKRKFSGCNLINNAKRRLGGGEIGPREQISQHSWGRTPFGRVSKAHNTAFLLHASANSNWNSVSCHTSFRSVSPLLGSSFFFFSFSFNFTHSLL